MILSGLLALALVYSTGHLPAYANEGMIAYKPGVIQAAVAKGETVVIHYKSTW